MKQLIKEYFGIDVSRIKELGGYDNANYLVFTVDEKYIFKTYSTVQKDIILSVIAENKVLKYLDSLDTSKPIIGINDTYIFKSQFEGKEIIFRLLSFVDGDFLNDVEHTDDLLKSFGHFLAEMDLKLKDYSNLFTQSNQHAWDNQYWKLNQDLISYIRDPQKRGIVEDFFSQYEKKVVPNIPFLRKQIIHNDANQGNVLVKNRKVSGIIDFGDVAFTFLINELANAMAYILLDKEHPLNIACILIEAYVEKLPLRKAEIDILYFLIATRLSVSVCNSAYGKVNDPNNAHIITTEKAAFELLEKWIVLDSMDVRDRFRRAAGI